MSTTATTAKAGGDIIRTYETFEVRWYEAGQYVSTWSNYDREAAERLVAGPQRDGRHGEIVRKTFEVRIPERLIPIANIGIAERPAVAR